MVSRRIVWVSNDLLSGKVKSILEAVRDCVSVFIAMWLSAAQGVAATNTRHGALDCEGDVLYQKNLLGCVVERSFEGLAFSLQ